MICAKEGKGAVGLLKYMPPRLYSVLGNMPVAELMRLEEIRLGRGMPVCTVNDEGCFYVTSSGKRTKESYEGYRVYDRELDEIFRLLCEGSVYAVEENVKKGFFTIPGGHRIGVCGMVNCRNGVVENMRQVSFINIRVAREIIGAAEGIIDFIADETVKNTLIISPPGGGKTTLLRDICRILSGDGFNWIVGVADERSEICSMHEGNTRNNVGYRTCIMDGCPKNVAMEMLLRSMAPDVIITDEIGGTGDEKALYNVLRCGVKVITSAHGRSYEEVAERIPFIKECFELAVVLDKKKIKEVKSLGV